MLISVLLKREAVVQTYHTTFSPTSPKISENRNSQSEITTKLLLTSTISTTQSFPQKSKDEFEKFMEIQMERKSRVDEICEKYGMKGRSLKKVNAALVADIGEKFVFCNNYKVSMKKIEVYYCAVTLADLGGEPGARPLKVQILSF